LRKVRENLPLILSKKQVPYICYFNYQLIVQPTAQAGTKTKRTVGYENNDKKQESVYSKRVKAGKRRTYFFDVKATRGNDFYLTITESRKRFNEESYERHKIFLYKEDFNKFLKGLTESVDYVKTELMPDFDFDAFSHENQDGEYVEGEMAKVFELPQNGNGQEHDDELAKIEPVHMHEQHAVGVPITADLNGNGSLEEVDKW
jgi:hypothetical protein